MIITDVNKVYFNQKQEKIEIESLNKAYILFNNFFDAELYAKNNDALISLIYISENLNSDKNFYCYAVKK